MSREKIDINEIYKSPNILNKYASVQGKITEQKSYAIFLESWDWRHGSTFKNTGCFFREPGFNS